MPLLVLTTKEPENSLRGRHDVDATRQKLRKIFEAACRSVDPYQLLRRSISLRDNILAVETERESATYDLNSFRKIALVAVGKASTPMAAPVIELLRDRIDTIIVGVKHGWKNEMRASSLIDPNSSHRPILPSNTPIIEAGHPLPDRGSVDLGKAIITMADNADEHTLIVNLISGGASALCCAPYRPSSVALEDIITMNRLMIYQDMNIEEINTVRKHLSALKGGRYIERSYPATSLNLILSDVAGDNISAIGSGLTAPDPTTYRDALNSLDRHNIANKTPRAVIALLQKGADGALPETIKSHAPAFSRSRSIIIGSNRLALQAANEKARRLGYHTLPLSSTLQGDTENAALFLHSIAANIAEYGQPIGTPALVLTGGETTLKIRGSGKGGRNQQMSLAFLRRLEQKRIGAVFFIGRYRRERRSYRRGGGICRCHYARTGPSTSVIHRPLSQR